MEIQLIVNNLYLEKQSCLDSSSANLKVFNIIKLKL